MPVLAPPNKPIVTQRTRQRPNRYYTLHTRKNDAFTLKINDNSKTSVVGFRSWDDAFLIAQMIETYFINNKEWPDTRTPGTLILPNSQVGNVLQYVYIQKWEFNDLKYMCTGNILDMISVESLGTRKMGYAFSGKAIKFSAPIDFYQDRFNLLLSANPHPEQM